MGAGICMFLSVCVWVMATKHGWVNIPTISCFIVDRFSLLIFLFSVINDFVMIFLFFILLGIVLIVVHGQ